MWTRNEKRQHQVGRTQLYNIHSVTRANTTSQHQTENDKHMKGQHKVDMQHLKHKHDVDSKQMKHQHTVDTSNFEIQHCAGWNDTRHKHIVLRNNRKINPKWAGII